MKYLVLSLTILLSGVACTKKVQKIDFKSPLVYEQAHFKDVEQFADVAGMPITKEQIFQNSPGIQETKVIFMNHLFLASYKLALKSGSGKETNLTFYGSVSKQDWSAWLKDMNVEPSESVVVEFVEPVPSKIASIGGREIKQSELIKNELGLIKLQRRYFEERMRKLNSLAVKRLLLKESKDQKISMAELINDKILPGVKEASEDEVRQFALEKGLTQGDLDKNDGRLFKQMKTIVNVNHRQSLVDTYVAKHISKKPVRVNIEIPTNIVTTPSFGDKIPSFGSGDVSVVVFSNPVCENCAEVNELVKKWRKNPRFKVSYIFHMKDNERQARMVSEASLCVYNKHREKFWDFIEAYKTEGNAINEQLIYDTAAAADVDSEQFKSCFLKREDKMSLDAEIDIFKNYGFNSYPLVMINGRVFEAPKDAAILEAQIKSDLEKNTLFAKIVTWFKSLVS